VGAELFREDGWINRGTEMAKSVVAFRSFADTPKHDLKSIAA